MARNGSDKITRGLPVRSKATARVAPAPLDWQAALIDLSFEPIFAWDWDQGIIAWNAGAERQYGFTRTEVLGKSPHELLATKHPISLRRFLKKLAADGYWIGEIRHITKDGRELIIESRQQVIVQDGRSIVMESNRDITERREGESQVALLVIIGELIRKVNDPEELLYAAAEAVGQYFKAKRSLFDEVHLERDLEIIHRDYCNGVESIAGRHKLSAYSSITTNEMIAGRTVANADSKKDPRTAKLYKEVYGPAAERSYVAVPLMRDDKWTATLWISDNRPRKWSEAEVTLLEVVGERVWLAVEKMQSEKALRKSEELFSRFMQHLPGLAWIKDVDGRYIYANDAVERAFGIELKKLYGKKDDEVFPDEIAAQFRKNDRLALHQQKEVQIIETLEQDDGLHHSIVSKFPISDSAGRPVLIGGMAVDITDRIQAEVALRASEERSKLAQEAGKVGIFDWDIIADKTYWSETMWSIYGEEKRNKINPDEPFWSGHLHDDDRERVKRNINGVIKNGSEFRDEFRIVLPDGSVRWIEAKAAVSRDVSGIATRMYGVNSDITARKEAEEKLRLSDNQLRLVTNAMPALISYIDKDEIYRFANQRYFDWLGIPPDEVIGQQPRDVFGPEAYQVLKPYIDKALAGENCSFETFLTYGVLGERYVHISYVPNIGADGVVHGYYGLTHDLTDLKNSQDLLRSSEERLGLMMESVTDYAILTLDDAGRVNSWNKGAEIIFGYAPDQILGRHSQILFTAEDIESGIPELEMATARKKNRSSDERWMMRNDGKPFFAHGVMMPLHAGGKVNGYAKILSDLTEKKRHAEELQRAHDELEIRVDERTKELAESNTALVEEINEREIAEKERIELLSRLVSSQEMERRRIARDLHDQMGQRLTALRLKIESLQDLSPDSEDFRPRLKRLQEIAERIDSDVSFLAWELRPTILDDLGLLDAVKAFADEWSRHNDMTADFHSAGLPKDRLDREVETHLYRITQEALNNVVKHANAEHVTVQLEGREQNVILIIEDDGAGFDTTSKRDTSESGSGLGLVGMRERALLIGGEIEIESAPGKGTTIYVRVPFSK